MSFLPVLLPLVIVAIIFFLVFRSRARKLRILKTGTPVLAQVIDIIQTGTEVNQVPMMRLNVQLEQAGLPSRTIEIRQLIGLGEMPRAGEQVFIMLDPENPNKAVYAGLASSIIAASTAVPGGNLNAAQTTDMFAIAPALRENGKIGVGTIQAIQPMGTAARITVEVDSIVDVKRNVTFDQMMSGFNYQVGDRAYLLIDKSNPDSAALMPLSMSGGKKIDKAANRLDPLVLDPQLKRQGAIGEGTILACEQMPLGDARLADKGFQRWHLHVHVVPQDGTGRVRCRAEHHLHLAGQGGAHLRRGRQGAGTLRPARSADLLHGLHRYGLPGPVRRRLGGVRDPEIHGGRDCLGDAARLLALAGAAAVAFAQVH